MKRFGFLYDITRCTGCKACQVACKEHNSLGAGEFFRRVDTFETTIDGDWKWIHFSGACNHCKDPFCVAVCPTGAMYVAEDGTVQHHDTLCIGCGRCVHHCPYGAPSLNQVTGYAQKCDACADLRRLGREPACAAACPVRALHFGPLDMLQKEYGGGSSDGVSFLPPTDLTSPSLALRRKTCMPAAAEANFTPKTTPAAGFSKNTDERFVILGGGAAAVSAAEAIRLRNRSAKIQILSCENRAPYSRPMLSKGLLNSFSPDRYSITSDDWLTKNRIELILGQSVTALDADNKTVTLENGDTIAFDKCIYALGAGSFIPTIPGIGKRGVFALRSAADLEEIRKQMLFSKSAAVIGGGITGLEFAWELKKAGLQVTILELAPVLLERLLDPKSAELLRRHIEDTGISVVTSAAVQSVEGDSAVQQILLEDGRTIPAELVVLSTGYRANIDIAAKAGLSVGSAVIVNEAMETSCRDIYACGDCTNFSSSTWTQSREQGTVAGANAAGDALVYRAAGESAMIHTAGTSLLTMGDMGKHPGESYRIVYGRLNGTSDAYFVNPRQTGRTDTAFAFAFLRGKLVGATMIGTLSEMRFVEDAIRQQCDEQVFCSHAVQKGIELC